jgi:hypothetical protein
MSGMMTYERLGVTPIKEKLVLQQRPSEAPVRSGVISQTDNGKRGRRRPKMTWEESVKRDLKN